LLCAFAGLGVFARNQSSRSKKCDGQVSRKDAKTRKGAEQRIHFRLKPNYELFIVSVVVSDDAPIPQKSQIKQPA
jgi:hypothetical protein